MNAGRPSRNGTRTGMAIPHPESPASPHNPANDLPQYRPPRPIGHGETLPPHTTTSVPVQQRTGTDVMQGTPYQQIQYVVE